MKFNPFPFGLGLTAKTVIVTSVVALLAIGAFLYTGRTFDRLHAALDDLATHEVEQLMTAVRLSQQTEALVGLGMVLSQASSHEERRRTLLELRDHLGWIRKVSRDLSAVNADLSAVARVQLKLQEFSENVRQLDEQVNERIEGVGGRENALRIQQLATANRALARELSVLMGYFSAANRSHLTDTTAQLSAEAHELQNRLRMLAGFLILAVVLSGLYFERRLVQRILRLQRAVDRDVVDPDSIDRQGTDEIARLSSTVSDYVRRIQSHEAKMRQSNEELAFLAEHDPLTQLANRRHFETAAGRVLRYGSMPVCVAVGDIDHFKCVNDVHGHAQGDAVLVHVARILERGLRANDVLARLGGEEFGAVLPVHSMQEAGEVLERIRADIASCAYTAQDGTLLPLSISFGCVLVEGPPLSQIKADDHYRDALRTALDAADRAMYRAKRDGRNRVCYAEESLLTLSFGSPDEQ